MNKLLIQTLMVALLLMTVNGYSQLYSETNVVIKISNNTPVSAWVTAGTPLITAYGETTPGNADMHLSMASNIVNARGVIAFKRSRGTLSAPAVVLNNDYLGSVLAGGYDGTTFQGPAAVDFYVDGTPTPGNIPARISLVTGTNAGNRIERLKVGSNGDFTFNGSQMFLQKSNGRLGLGTLTPGGQLQLSLDQARKPSTSTWTIASDARLKTIDGAYSKGLDAIMQLKPLTYHYKNTGSRIFDEATLTTPAVGFTAQEVQKIFPEAVGTDEDGYLNMNIHPILIASINAIRQLKEQLDGKDNNIVSLQAQLEKQQAQLNSLLDKLDALQKAQAQCCATAQTKISNQNETIRISDVSSVEQNAPNPFSNTTVIKYHLAPSVKSAQMQILNVKGAAIKTMSLAPNAEGQVTLSAGALPPGEYIYTLIVEGKRADSKKMQIMR